MAESRRVQLTTLPSAAPLSPGKPPSSAALRPEERPPEPAADTGTVRLLLELFEPDERSFPEFSYTQLLDDKINQTKVEIPLSRFEEEEKRQNDEAAAIARRFEEKYGGKPKKKQDRIQDLIDIGFGYDDEDSFIDNSEPYDVFVPSSITTKFGGFYVNSGVLQFRQASDSEDVPEEKTPEITKKRKLNGGQDKPKKKACTEDVEMKTEEEQKSNTLPETGPGSEIKKKKKKKKKMAGPLSVTSMLKKFQREKEKERLNQTMPLSVPGLPTMPMCPADAGGGGGSGLSDPLLSLIGSTNDHALIQAANALDLDIDLDSLLDASEDTTSSKPGPLSLAAAETQLFHIKPEDQTLVDMAPPAAPPASTKTNQQPKLHPDQPSSSSSSLPENLPPGLEENIQKLMKVIKALEGESKLKFFTPEINAILLDIELQCREQAGPLRSKVYTHLSSFLPCSRDTLLKRVKKLLLKHMEQPVCEEDPLLRLKEAIGKAMPEQIASFQDNCQAYEQSKMSKATEEEKEGKHHTGPEDNVEEKGGRRGPRKLFKWNEEIRECLCRVLKVKMETLEKERRSSQEMEEFIKTLLESEVQPLWPKGWMQSRVLIRESRKMLNLSSLLSVKRTRPEKKHQPSIVAPPPPSDRGGVVLEQDSEDVFIVEPDVPALKTLEGKPRSRAEVAPSSSSESGAPPPPPPPVPTPVRTPSLLNLLADQALAREQPLSISPELLVAAVAKYQQSVQGWSPTLTPPPLPPPPPPPPPSPPQSSPVDLHLTGVCQVVFPHMLQMGDFARHMGAGQIQIISDDSDTTIQ